METNNSPHKHISNIRVILLIGLVVLVVTAGILYVTKSRTAQPRAQLQINIPAISNVAMFGFDLQRTHFNQSERILNTSNVSQLIPYCSTSTAAYINSSPAVVDGIVYIGSNDKAMYAFDAKTGKILWAHNANDGVGSSPAVANGIVYVGSDDNNLYAFNARTGATVWIYTTGGPVWSSPVVANGVVYVGSNDNVLYALNAVTGRVLWTHTTDNFVSSSPAVVNGVVYVGSEDDKLYAFDASNGNTLLISSVIMPFSVSST